MRDLTRPDDAPEPTGNDAPCNYELRITLTTKGIDEIGGDSQAELRGYLRALVNHGLITGAEQLRQLDVLLGIAQERAAKRQLQHPRA